MKTYFNILGYKKLLVVLMALIVFRISITIPFCKAFLVEPTTQLSIFLMFAFGLVFIFAGNNVVDIFFEEKRKIQKQINKKNIRLKDYPDIKKLQGLYIILEAVGIIACMSAIFWQGNSFINYILVIILTIDGYGYAYTGKKQYKIGNRAMAIMYVMLFANIYFFDYFPLYTSLKNSLMESPFLQNLKDANFIITAANIILCTMVYLLTMAWDITGDLTNIKEDKQKNYNTLAIVLGEEKTKKLLYFYIVLIIVAYGVYWYFTMPYLNIAALFIGLGLLALPLIYYVVQLKQAKKNTDYNALYSLLGMVFISILFIMSFIKNIFLNEQLAITL